jgi:transposase
MEACLSAHFVSRTLRALGHEPRIIPAVYVKPFVKGQKNDYNDAEAIAEAALRPNLRLVREKTQDQLDLQACHRVRARLVSMRTGTTNQIRSFLLELGRESEVCRHLRTDQREARCADTAAPASIGRRAWFKAASTVIAVSAKKAKRKSASIGEAE